MSFDHNLLRGAMLGVAFSLLGCAHGDEAGQRDPGASASSGDEKEAAEEQARLEAARRHPIAHPEPRPALPDKAPPPRPQRGLPEKAPPPRERGLPEKAPQPREQAPAEASALPSDEAPAGTAQVVSTVEPPPAPVERPRPPRPASGYVWAPGYWYWYGGDYVWISGGWLPPRVGYTYVGARWVWGSGGWSFVPGGWAIGVGGTVVYPVYRHRYLYGPGYRHHHHSGYHSYRHRPRAHRSPQFGRSGRRHGRPGGRTRSRPR